jgi:hypothetical protein
MRYRIKITQYKSERKTYTPYVKSSGWFGGWKPLDYEGGTWISSYEMDRFEALKAIDKHFAGNKTVHKVKFEYINKTIQ